MSLRNIAYLLLSFMFLMPLIAAAQEKPNVVLRMSVQKEVVVKDASGKLKTEWREVQNFQPGELLKYVISYTNEGAVEARNVVIMDPVPPGTTFAANGAEGKNAEITYSVDGKAFQVPPLLKYTVKIPGAKEQEVYATPDMYTHIKWKISKPVPPGGTGLVSFKVKVK